MNRKMRSSKPFGPHRLFKSAGSNGNNPQNKRFFAVTITGLSLLTSVVIANQGISRADSPVTFAYYIDAPLVQNSYVWTDYQYSGSTHLASFNGLSKNADCEFDDFAGATFSNNPGGRCLTDDTSNWGGATAPGSEPSTGGYANATWGGTSMYGSIQGAGATITFDEPQRYFGIWWSAGSYGNQLKFYSGDQIVGATSADEVMSRLDNPSSSFGSNGGNSFSRELYYGHPASYSPAEIDDWSQVSEISDITLLEDYTNFSKGVLDPSEPFTYIHFFTDNNATFDRVVMSAPGNGFEFDNIVVSDEVGLLNNLNPRLIEQGTVTQPVEVQFNSNSSQGGVGNTFTRIEGAPNVLPSECPSWPNNCFYNQSNAHFIGWNTEANGSGIQFGTDQDQFGYQYFNSELESAVYDYAASITLYAQWSDNFSFYPSQFDPYPSTYINVLHGNDLVLPTPASRNGYTFSGWSIINWEEYDPVTESYGQTYVGPAGEIISVDQYVANGYYQFYETWSPDSSPISNPVIGASSSTIPVDPRVSVATIPSLPVDTASFNLCVAEVTDPSGNVLVQGSDLTFSTSPATSTTGEIVIAAGSPLTANGSRFIRIKVADTSFQNCETGSSITVELKPLQIGGANTVTVPIGRQ